MAAQCDEHGNVIYIGEQGEEREEQIEEAEGGSAARCEGPPPPGCGE